MRVHKGAVLPAHSGCFCGFVVCTLEDNMLRVEMRLKEGALEEAAELRNCYCVHLNVLAVWGTFSSILSWPIVGVRCDF